MIKRRLGKTDLLVSEIGLGCYQLGGYTTINEVPITFGSVNEKTALKIINAALELGVNVFDTADYYSLGSSEKRLGKALKKHRSEIYILTKAGIIPSHPHNSTDLSYHYLLSAIDRSLNRLDTDYIDLFQTHKPPQTENEIINIEKAFAEIKAQGKANYCGISIGVRYDIGIELLKKTDFIDAIQLYFSLIDPMPLKELLPLAKKKKVGVIVAEPLAQGFLSGKYKPGIFFPKTDIRYYGYSKTILHTKLEKSQKFQFLIKNSRTFNQVALSYILSRNEISTCIPGSKSIRQLKSNIKSSEIKLTDNELKEISVIQSEWMN